MQTLWLLNAYKPQEKYLNWVCQHRVDGVKCNRGEISIQLGTFFDNTRLSVQNILWIVWHFVHHLTEKQCKQHTSISQNNGKTVVKWHGQCRTIANTWIRKHPPKLGGDRKIVEMDQSHFAGAPKMEKEDVLVSKLGEIILNGHLE